MAKKVLVGSNQQVYWNESIPIVTGYTKFESKERKKGTKIEVQFDPKEFSLNVRAREGSNRFFIRITEIVFLVENDLEKTIKLNRRILIDRNLLQPVKGFDE